MLKEYYAVDVDMIKDRDDSPYRECTFNCFFDTVKEAKAFINGRMSVKQHCISYERYYIRKVRPSDYDTHGYGEVICVRDSRSRPLTPVDRDYIE